MGVGERLPLLQVRGKVIRYSDPEFLNRVISVISFALREITLTISYSTTEPMSIESEVVRVVTHSTREISETT